MRNVRRDAPERELAGLFGRRRVGLFRRERTEVPEEVREPLRRYREVTRQLVRQRPAARAAERRLPTLRGRAHVIRPQEARYRLKDQLVRAAKGLRQKGVYSLVARAAPGLGAALSVVRVVRRVHQLRREMERDGGRGR